MERNALFGFYLEQGRTAYLSVFDFDRGNYKIGSAIFFELSIGLEFYAGALNYMRNRFFKQRNPDDPSTDLSQPLSGLS